jgi:hypothetical protein
MCLLDRTWGKENKARGVTSRSDSLERIKRGNGRKGRDDRSSGTEILMDDVFAKINPTEHLRLGKQVGRRKRN